MPMPHLLDIQTAAFQTLLVPDDVEGERQDVSLERVFRDLFPISDVNGKYSLDFLQLLPGRAEVLGRGVHRARHDLRGPAQGDAAAGGVRGGRRREAAQEHHREGSLPGRAADHDAARDVRHQRRRARRGEPAAPLARASCSRRTRTPTASGCSARGSSRSAGSWVEFTIDIHDVIYVHIDKKKKFPATALLRAFGYGNNADILQALLCHQGSGDHRQARRPAGAARGPRLPAGRGRGQPRGSARRAARRRGRRAHRRAHQRDAAQGREERPRVCRLHLARSPGRGAADLHPRPAQPHPGVRRGRARDGRGPGRARRRADGRAPEAAHQGGRPQDRGAAAGRPLRVAPDQEHAGQGPDPLGGRGAGTDLRAPPPGRRAEPGDRAPAAPEAVLQPQALRPRAGWAATRSTSG